MRDNEYLVVYSPKRPDDFGIQEELCSVLLCKLERTVKVVSGDKLFSDGEPILARGASVDEAAALLGLTQAVRKRGKDSLGFHIQGPSGRLSVVLTSENQVISDFTLGLKDFFLPSDQTIGGPTET